MSKRRNIQRRLQQGAKIEAARAAQPISFFGTYDPASDSITQFTTSPPDVHVTALTRAMHKVAENMLVLVLSRMNQLAKEAEAESDKSPAS